jgi:hypothetical protein
MKLLVLKPADFPMPYKECPPGLFLWGAQAVGLKTEYGQDGFCDTGETFCNHDCEVTPLRYEWEEI